MKRNYLLFITLLLVSVITVLTSTGLRASNDNLSASVQDANNVAPKVKPAPDPNKITEGYAFPELKFTSLTGKKVDIAKLKGKVVVIDFWATWCPPCRGAMPDVIKTYNKYHDMGLEIIGISLDKDKKQLQTYLKENGIKWEQYYDGLYWSNKIAKRFGIGAIPHMVIIDKRGAVYFNTDTAHKKYALQGDDLTKAIEKLCSEPAN